MGSRYYALVGEKRRKKFIFLFVTNTFEMQIILCNILKGWGQTTKYIRWPQRIITTYTPSSLCLECIMGECSCIIVKSLVLNLHYSFHLQILLLNLRHLSNKNEEGLSGLPFDKTKKMINSRVHCYSRRCLCCASEFKHFRTDIFILLWTENNKELPVNWN